jgi:hypothetical protein
VLNGSDVEDKEVQALGVYAKTGSVSVSSYDP